MKMLSISTLKESTTMNKFTLPSVPDLPLGPQAGFRIHAEQLFFMDLDEAFYALTATNPDDWRNKSVYYLFDKLASPTHLRATLALFANAMEQLKRSKEAFFSFNLEFNMADEKLGSKRFLLQLGKLRTEGVSGMMACGGRLTDIHHMVNNGAPSLTIIKNNVVEKRIVAELQEEPTTKKIDLSARELEVLKLKSKGYDTREIAQTLNRSTLTIYSVVRDIKSKTRMEIIPLIKSLHEKGLLD